MCGKIRNSTEKDLKFIRGWLGRQNKNGVRDSFFCNLSRIEKMHSKKNLIVYIENDNDGPVAYQLGGLIEPGILEVRNDKRGQGIGGKLVEYCIEQAHKKDVCALKIECTPEGSICFWKKKGFTIYDDINRYAYKVLSKRLVLPKKGKNIPVEVLFYPENILYGSKSKALLTFKPKCIKTNDGVHHFDKRICVFTPACDWKNDPVISVEVNGKILYRDKAKLAACSEVGVKRCDNSIHLESFRVL